jgi:hypothetical protein
MAQCINGAELPAIQDLYSRWCQRKALKCVKDSSHQSHPATAMQVVPDCQDWDQKLGTASTPI